MRFLAIQAPLTRSYKQLVPAGFEQPFLETKVFLHFLQEHPLPGHPFQNLQFAFLIFGAKNPQYVGIQCQYYNFQDGVPVEPSNMLKIFEGTRQQKHER